MTSSLRLLHFCVGSRSGGFTLDYCNIAVLLQTLSGSRRVVYQFCIFVYSIQRYFNTIYRSNVIMFFLHRRFLDFFFYMSANSISRSINHRFVENFNTGNFGVVFLTLEYVITAAYICMLLDEMPPDVMLDLLDLFFQRFTLMRY